MSSESVTAVAPSRPLAMNGGRGTVLHLKSRMAGVYKSALCFPAPGQSSDIRRSCFSFLPAPLAIASSTRGFHIVLSRLLQDAEPRTVLRCCISFHFPQLFVSQGWETDVDYGPAAFVSLPYKVAPREQRRVRKWDLVRISSKLLCLA